MFADIAASFVPREDNTNRFEVNLFGGVAAAFGVLTGICCGALCCCALRGEKLDGQFD